MTLMESPGADTIDGAAIAQYQPSRDRATERRMRLSPQC
jgi:hypothetical protein